MVTDVAPRTLESPERSLLGELGYSFTRLQSLILALVGIIASIVVWWAAPDVTVQIGWLWITLIVASVMIWLLIDVARRLLGRQARFLPIVVTSLPSNGLTERPILILQPSELFGHGSLVTVFYVDDNGIELQVGSGYVVTIQTDRQIQVELTHWAAAHVGVLDGIKATSRDVLKRLLVKPSVTQGSLEGRAFDSLGVPQQDDKEESLDDGQ